MIERYHNILVQCSLPLRITILPTLHYRPTEQQYDINGTGARIQSDRNKTCIEQGHDTDRTGSSIHGTGAADTLHTKKAPMKHFGDELKKLKLQE